MKWLEVSLTISDELAEAVAELLVRYTSGGVVIEPTQINDNTAENSPVGPVVVRAYLPVDKQVNPKRQKIEEGLWHLGQIQPLPNPSFRVLEEKDWAQAWKAHYHPLPIGRSLLLLPSWYKVPHGDRLPLILDPGMAFGTGMHPSTRLCLIAIEDYLQKGQNVIDLGCGSGILGIAAARLGASQVLALDIDSQAVEVAIDNVRRNGMAKRVLVQKGSLDNLLDKTADKGPQAHMLIANLLAPTLEDMIPQGLPNVVMPGGHLILSGILDRQTDSLIEVSEQHGLKHIETRGENDWRTLILEVKSSAPNM